MQTYLDFTNTIFKAFLLPLPTLQKWEFSVWRCRMPDIEKLRRGRVQ